MSNKKSNHKQRLEARRHRQEPPAEVVELPDSSEVDGEPEPYVDVYVLEPMLKRMQRYFVTHGIEPTEEGAAQIEAALDDDQWMDEPLPDTATPVERAQELIYEAWTTDDPDEQLALAEEARELSEDCADAWIIFGDQAESPGTARRYYRKGVAAGERALGGDLPAEPTESAWDLLPALPWMRARQRLAEIERTLGDPDTAAAIYRDLVTIDPDDLLNVRLALSAVLHEAERDDEQLALADRFVDDPNIYWPWIRALTTFRKEGDSEAAVEALDRAVERNRWVPVYLLGARRIGNLTLVDAERSPDAAEGGMLVMVSISQWLMVPGAIDWLRRHAGPAARITAMGGRVV